ncbi:MAG: enolase C-terminal domain-like protein [Acidimicrobiales bacterium]
MPLPPLGRLALAAVELRRVAMPLIEPFHTADGIRCERDVLLVRVLGTEGEEGWGECVAESAPSYAPEYVDGCAHVLRSFILPGVLAWSSIGVDDVHLGVPGHEMAQAALVDAVLDALLRRADRPLAAWLGAAREAVPATLTLGLGDPPDAGPYRSVKLKLDASTEAWPDAERLRADGVEAVSADANGSLDLAGLLANDRAGFDHIEQPLGVGDLVGHVEARRRSSTPIALDEPITGVDVIRTVAALGAADLVVVKPGRVGGVVAARACVEAATALGLGVKVGGMLETGIGRAATLAVAALPGCTVPADLSASDRYWGDDDLTEPCALDTDGCLTVPTGPGTGVTVRADLLGRRTTAVETHRR